MKARVLLGSTIVLLGVFLLLNEGNLIGPGHLIGTFWPSMFILPLSILFHWMYFSMLDRRGSGLLIPGGILLTVGIVCQIGMLFDNWGVMWPGFILAPAVGLLELYLFGYRNKWLLVPIYILSGLSFLFFAIFSIGSMLNAIISFQPIVAVLLIAGGASLLLTHSKNRSR